VTLPGLGQTAQEQSRALARAMLPGLGWTAQEHSLAALQLPEPLHPTPAV